MPWQTDSPMSQRLAFIHAVVHRAPGECITDVCRAVGISEKTGHKWLQRFSTGGPEALADRSHAPQVPAHQVPAALVDRICKLRDQHRTWGARKLREALAQRHPQERWPAPSTITAILARAGLLTRRRRSVGERTAWARAALTQATAPNEVWTADFKGEFRLTTGPQCYPLTVVDLHAHYALSVTALAGTASAPAEAVFRRCFTDYGVPQVIRTDNGVPFAGPGALGGLSRLAVWWIRLGIRPERIAKGVPQQNGAHERLHRTLKAEATRPPSATLAAQQTRFDRWRHTYNEERPHESLGNTPPATHYQPSPRPLPRRLPPLEYPAAAALRRVDAHGAISWQGERIFLSETLAGEYVGLESTAADEWTISFGPLQLGVYSDTTLAFRPHVHWTTSSDRIML